MVLKSWYLVFIVAFQCVNICSVFQCVFVVYFIVYFSVLEMYFNGVVVFSFWTDLIVSSCVQFLNWTGCGNSSETDLWWGQFFELNLEPDKGNLMYSMGDRMIMNTLLPSNFVVFSLPSSLPLSAPLWTRMMNENLKKPLTWLYLLHSLWSPSSLASSLS